MTKAHFARRLMLGLVMLAPLSAAARPIKAPPAAQVRTAWIDPYNDVTAESAACDGKLCDWAAWATPETAQGARDGGTPRLVGTELLQDYRANGPDAWQGQVFIPDMGCPFSSTIMQTEPENLKISGCVMGGLIYKAQIWHRG